jgi:hypothetical protein
LERKVTLRISSRSGSAAAQLSGVGRRGLMTLRCSEAMAEPDRSRRLRVVRVVVGVAELAHPAGKLW